MDGQSATVSEWLARGTIVEYIGKNSVNGLGTVSGFNFSHIPSAEPK
jgi:hypothetical protein